MVTFLSASGLTVTVIATVLNTWGIFTYFQSLAHSSVQRPHHCVREVKVLGVFLEFGKNSDLTQIYFHELVELTKKTKPKVQAARMIGRAARSRAMRG